jgi:hypothetical protein
MSERDLLKETYGFDRWPAPRADDAVARVRPARAFLPALESGPEALLLSHRVPLPVRRAFSDELVGGDGVQVSVVVDEGHDAAEAREALIDKLSTSMAPRLPDCDELLGEVCFQGWDDPPGVVLFVRGRFMIAVSSVGPSHVDVRPIARRVDAQLVAHLEGEGPAAPGSLPL